MVYEFRFPDIGEGIVEGEIVKWRVKVGDSVKEHDVLGEIETDKAIAEMPSPRRGVILKILHKEGDTIKVGDVLVVIDDGSGKENYTPKKSVGIVGELEDADNEIKTNNIPKSSGGGSHVVNDVLRHVNALAVPAVRRLARETNVDLSSVNGTGAGGRITEEDVRNASTATHEEVAQVRIMRKYDVYGFVDRIPLKGVRKAIARNMVNSIRTAVHVTHIDEADATELVKLREKDNKKYKKKMHITFLPYVIKACISALETHPKFNSSLDEEHEEIVMKKYYNIGIAVDTEEGLMVPVIKRAEIKSIVDLTKEIEDLADKARKRTLDIMDLKGGTFTITNVGSIGGMYATPIINYSEVAILALGRMYDKPIAVGKKVKVVKVLPLSLSFDHRVVDGADAAKFVNALKDVLENPQMIKEKSVEAIYKCEKCHRKHKDLDSLIECETDHLKKLEKKVKEHKQEIKVHKNETKKGKVKKKRR